MTTLHQLPFGVCVNRQKHRIALQGLIMGRPNLWTVSFGGLWEPWVRAAASESQWALGPRTPSWAIWGKAESTQLFISMIGKFWGFFCKTLITDLRNAFYLFFKFLKRCEIFIFCILLFCFLAVMGLRCCTRLSLVALRKGATPYCGAQASHCSSFSCCGVLALGHVGSVVAAPRL